MNQNWLDRVTKEDIEKYLNKLYSFEAYGQIINNLESADIDIKNKANGNVNVEISLMVHDDYDIDECFLHFNEYIDKSKDISYILDYSGWAELVRSKNIGRTINGKTYDEARLDYLEKYINNYFMNRQKSLERKKQQYIEKLKKMRNELNNNRPKEKE